MEMPGSWRLSGIYAETLDTKGLTDETMMADTQ
jgi:hypothetical protein